MWQVIREWIPSDDAEPSFDLFEIPSFSTAIELTELAEPEKPAARKKHGKAQRTAILRNYQMSTLISLRARISRTDTVV
jgi:hypothetical protein